MTSKLSILLDKLCIVLHDLYVVQLVGLSLLIESLPQLLDTIDQVVQLALLLLLDLVVLLLILDSLLLINESHELFVHTVFQLVVVIDVLGNPIDSILVESNVAVVISNLSSGQLDAVLKVILLVPKFLNDETKLGIQVVVLTELLILGIGLHLELFCFDLTRCDVLSQISDLEVQHELELRELVSLSLQLLDVVLTFSNLNIFISDIILQLLDLFAEDLDVLLLLLEVLILLTDLTLKTFNLIVDLRHLIV